MTNEIRRLLHFYRFHVSPGGIDYIQDIFEIMFCSRQLSCFVSRSSIQVALPTPADEP